MKLSSILGVFITSIFPIAGWFSSSDNPDKPTFDKADAVREFGQKYSRNHNVQFLLEANPTCDESVRYGLLMNSSEKISVDDGRKCATDFFVAFITMLRTDKRVKSYLDYTDKDECYRNRDVREIRNVGFRIDFWDENVDRIMPPYLAQIMFEGGNFYYYEADPKTLELQLVRKESYQEALKECGKSFAINQKSIFDITQAS